MMHTQRKIPSSRRRQAGSSLLEVLIAVLVMAIGMLGMAALQTLTLKNSNSTSLRSQAVIHSYSAFDMLRINRVQAVNGNFNVTDWTCAAVEAEEGDTTDYSLFNTWLGRAQADLGAGTCGRLVCNATSCVVSVRVDDSRAGGSSTLDFVTSSRL